MTLLRTSGIIVVSTIIAFSTFVTSYSFFHPDMKDGGLQLGLFIILLTLLFEHTLLWFHNYAKECRLPISRFFIKAILAIGMISIIDLWGIFSQHHRLIDYFSAHERNITIFLLLNVTINYFLPIILTTWQYCREKYVKNYTSAYMR